MPAGITNAVVLRPGAKPSEGQAYMRLALFDENGDPLNLVGVPDTVPWVEIPLVNGWRVYDDLFPQWNNYRPEFAKVGPFLCLHGTLEGTQASSGVAAVLPEDMRPDRALAIRVQLASSPGSWSVATLRANGNLDMSAPFEWVVIDGMYPLP